MKQSELLRKQADVMDIAEKHGIDDWTELVWVRDREGDCWWHPGAWLTSYSQHRLALGVVEGRPVFEGDELWCKDGMKHKIIGVSVNGDLDSGEYGYYTEGYLSWNQPKPKTVMVELLIEDAEYYRDSAYVNSALNIACRKALEAIKQS